MEKVQHEKIQIATMKYGKSAQELCTIVHKWVRDHSLMARYTLA